MSYSKINDRHNDRSAYLNTTGTFITGSPNFTGDPLTSGYPNTMGTMLNGQYNNQTGVLRLYAAENVVAYLTGIKGYGVSTDKDLNTTFSAHSNENKTYKFDVREFHYALFEGEKIYITQSGRKYEQREADRRAAELAKRKVEAEKIRAEEIEQENQYKIKNFNAVTKRLAAAENYQMLNEDYKEVLDHVLDIISTDRKIDLDDLFGLSPAVRAALIKNKKKYKRRYQ